MPTVQVPLRTQLVINGHTIDYPLLQVAVDRYVLAGVKKIVKRQWVAGIDQSVGTDVLVRFPMLGEFADELVDNLVQYLREHWSELSVGQVESIVKQVQGMATLSVAFDVDESLGGVIGYATLKVAVEEVE